MMTSQSLQLSDSRKIVELTDKTLAKEHHKASYMLPQPLDYFYQKR